MTSSAPGFLPNSAQPSTSRSHTLLRAWLPVLLCAAIFALESTAAFGADRTSAPLHSLCQSLFGTALDQNWSDLHHFLRKTGHFLGYGAFSLVSFRAFWFTFRNQFAEFKGSLQFSLACHTFAVTAAALVASADEFHQTFLPNRTGTLTDVLLDTTGAFTLQLALFLLLRLHATRQSSALASKNQPTSHLSLAA